jgi:hypothetical protein
LAGFTDTSLNPVNPVNPVEKLFASFAFFAAIPPPAAAQEHAALPDFAANTFFPIIRRLS